MSKSDPVLPRRAVTALFRNFVGDDSQTISGSKLASRIKGDANHESAKDVRCLLGFSPLWSQGDDPLILKLEALGQDEWTAETLWRALFLKKNEPLLNVRRQGTNSWSTARRVTCTPSGEIRDEIGLLCSSDEIVDVILTDNILSVKLKGDRCLEFKGNDLINFSQSLLAHQREMKRRTMEKKVRQARDALAISRNQLNSSSPKKAKKDLSQLPTTEKKIIDQDLLVNAINRIELKLVQVQAAEIDRERLVTAAAQAAVRAVQKEIASTPKKKKRRNWKLASTRSHTCPQHFIQQDAPMKKIITNTIDTEQEVQMTTPSTNTIDTLPKLEQNNIAKVPAKTSTTASTKPIVMQKDTRLLEAPSNKEMKITRDVVAKIRDMVDADFSEHNLGDSDIAAVCMGFMASAGRNLAYLGCLHLGKNRIGDAGVELLCSTLVAPTAGDSHVQCLNLRCNRVGINGALALAKAIERNRAHAPLLELDLSENPAIGARGSAFLISAIKSDPPLRRLRLAECSTISATDAWLLRKIATALPQNTNLELLDISRKDVQFCSDDLAPVFSVFLNGKNTTLSQLMISPARAFSSHILKNASILKETEDKDKQLSVNTLSDERALSNESITPRTMLSEISSPKLVDSVDFDQISAHRASSRPAAIVSSTDSSIDDRLSALDAQIYRIEQSPHWKRLSLVSDLTSSSVRNTTKKLMYPSSTALVSPSAPNINLTTRRHSSS